MQLKELLFGVSIDAVLGSTSVSIEDVTSDSRALGSNSLFVAIRGEHHDGHDHISDAVKKGAVAVLCEELPKKKKDGVTYVQTPQSRSAYAVVASNYHNNPSSGNRGVRFSNRILFLAFSGTSKLMESTLSMAK